MLHAGLKLGFGPHYHVDAWGCPPELLSNIDLIKRTFEQVVVAIDMHPLGEIVLYHVNPEDITCPEDDGESGILVFAESHMSWHGFTGKGWFFADVFSCKPFDHRLVRAILKRNFRFTGCQTRLIYRGKNFPRSQPRPSPNPPAPNP